MFKYLLVAFLVLSGSVSAAPPDFVTYPAQGRWEAGTDFYADILNHLKGQPERLESRYLCSHENTHTLDSDIAMGAFRAKSVGVLVRTQEPALQPLRLPLQVVQDVGVEVSTRLPPPLSRVRDEIRRGGRNRARQDQKGDQQVLEHVTPPNPLRE
jgi:hypothetical protein